MAKKINIGSLNLIFVDCEANMRPSPATGKMTEFGAVDFRSRRTFHGHDDSEGTMREFYYWIISALNYEKAVFVSDNPAYDWQWINFNFDRYGIKNPFGHSARRISDFYAGLRGDFTKTQEWKNFRKTPHDHNPVNDAMGNVEAFETTREKFVRHTVWCEDCKTHLSAVHEEVKNEESI